MKLRKHMTNRAGMTLIEVLVALAVFAIGILGIVQIFPTGFGILKHSLNATVTDRLAQAELERVQSGGGLPAGILSGYLDMYGVFRFVDTDFTNLNDSYYWDKNGNGKRDANEPEYADVNKYHYVFEESTPIPVPAANNLAAGSMYMLKFSPIVWTAPTSITVYSGRMSRRAIPDDLSYLKLGSGDYAMDYNAKIVYVRPDSRQRTFTISYSYWYDDAGKYKLASVASESYPVAAATPQEQSRGYQSFTLTLTNGLLQFGSDELHRGFDLLNSGDAWSTDNPYEYKVVDTVRGVLAFNPNGYGRDEPTSSGMKPIVARINYDVLDWHILHEDRKVPAEATSDDDPVLNVRLSLGTIKKLGFSLEFDGTKYAGLWKNTPELRYDMIVVDLEDGAKYTLKYSGDVPVVDTVVDPLDGVQKAAYSLDYRYGVIHFNPYFRGHSVRVYYRSQGDWAVQVYRAFSSYQRFYRDNASTPVNLSFRQFYRGSNNAANYPDEYGKLYFPLSYMGQEVTLNYTYRVLQQDGVTYKYYTANGEVYKLSDDPKSPDANSPLFCYVDVASKLNSRHAGELAPGARVELMPDDGPNPEVFGSSLGARVIRKDTGEGFNGGHWKKSDLRTSISLSL